MKPNGKKKYGGNSSEVKNPKTKFDITELLKADGKDAEQFAKEAEKLVQK